MRKEEYSGRGDSKCKGFDAARSLEDKKEASLFRYTLKEDESRELVSSVKLKAVSFFSADLTMGFELLLLCCEFFPLSCIDLGEYSAVLEYTKHIFKTKD